MQQVIGIFLLLLAAWLAISAGRAFWRLAPPTATTKHVFTTASTDLGLHFGFMALLCLIAGLVVLV